MKNKKQKTPKSLIPKYTLGGGKMIEGNSFSEQDTGNYGTSNIYNGKRTKNIYAKGENPNTNATTGQYVAAAGALTSGANNMYGVYNDPNATNRDKADSFDNTARSTTSAINPIIGTAIGVGDMIGKPIRNKIEAGDPETGKVKNRFAVKAGAVAGMFFDPGKWIGQISTGGLKDISGNAYVDDIEKNNLDAINAQKAEQNQYQLQQNQQNEMYQYYKNQNANQQYANGGIQYAQGGINAELEKSENSVTPNGEFTQYNGNSHTNGGIKTHLEQGEKVYSDKLKMPGTNKTFAQLNKPNNTNKEDKILESKVSSTSKNSAELMKMVKLKLSEQLFSAQEAFKKAKVANYAKKMGVKLPDESEVVDNSQEESREFAYGGFNGGDPTKTNLTPAQLTAQGYKPLGNEGTKSIYAQDVTIPGAKNYGPGTNSPTDKDKYNQFLTSKLQSGVSPDELVKQGYATPEGIKPLAGSYNQKKVYLDTFDEGPKIPNITPYAGQRTSINEVPKQSANQPWSTYKFNDLNGQTNNSIDRHFVNDSTLQGDMREVDMNKYLQTNDFSKSYTGKTLNQYRNSNVRSDAMGETQLPVGNYNVNKPVINAPGSYQKSSVQGFKNGGKKGTTPSYKYNPGFAQESNSDNIVVPGSTNYEPDFSGVLAPSAYDKQMDITDANTLDKSAWEVDYANNPNAPKPTNDDLSNNKFNWKNVATQSAYFAANNAGNIYDLARANKTETRKYNRATENLVTPNFRDADQKYLYMKNALKGASLGASGYLANLQQAHVNNVLNKAQIQQAADNTNAGIKNQVSQYNTGIANEEILANAKIRANARNIKQSAIASIGSNSANQMNDVRNTEMDQKKLDGLVKMYPALAKDPEMLKYIMSFKNS